MRPSIIGKEPKIHFYRAGDVINAICSKCQVIRPSNLIYADYHSTSKSMVVPNVLQAFCEECGTLTAIPDQSSPKIRDFVMGRLSPLEVRIAPQLEDVIYILGDRVGLDITDLTRILLGYYCKNLNQASMRKKLKSALKDDFASGKGSSRISLRVFDKLIKMLDEESKRLGLNRSQLIKAILVQAKLDLLDHSDSKAAQKFYEAARLIAA